MRVEPDGPVPCDLMVVGEAPGFEEQQQGRGFVGKSGRELWAAIERHTDLSREDFYVTNIVKHGLPKNRDPKPQEVADAIPEFLGELEAVGPRVVVTAGAFSTKGLLGDIAMADVHGIPHEVCVGGRSFTVFPIYHPAAGLHNKGYLAAFHWDITQLRRYLDGKTKARQAQRSDYQSVWVSSDLRIPVGSPGDGPGKSPRRKHQYSGFQSLAGGQEAASPPPAVVGGAPAGSVVAVDTEGWKEKPWGLSWTNDGKTACVAKAEDAHGIKFHGTIVMHNGIHDLPVLRAMGVECELTHDTQVLAYHDMLRTGSAVLESEAQNLGTLAYRELNIRLGELSEIPGVDLSAKCIPYSDSVRDYAGADVIATWRLFHAYKQRGLLDYQPYMIDMGQVPLVEDMIRIGIPFDADAALDYYMEVLTKLDAVTVDLKARAARMGNRDFNPGSHPQVRELITRRIGLKIRKRTKGGLASTNEKALSGHRDNPFVQKLQEYRELGKLKGTYVQPLLEALQ